MSKKFDSSDSLNYNGINVNMVNRIFKDTLKNLRKRPLEDLAYMTYKGYKFNVLPFLLNGASFYHSDDKVILCSGVSRFQVNSSEINIDEIKNNE